MQIKVNGKSSTVAAASDTPLLYVLLNELQLQGPRFGCGLAQCGSCSVLVDGVEKRSCVTPVSAVENKAVTTLQRAMLDEQAAQCGYCYNGMIVKAAELLSKNAKPDEAQIRKAMNGHLCRCGTYPSILQAVRRASEMMASEVPR
jgi:aerobic-type carbon monoxide dehydrogenase small subunit (CoxS/CutS family)